MANFNLGSLSDWQPIAAGEVLEFPVPETGFRLVDFDVIADSMVAIHAVSAESGQLVAYSDGLFNVRFSCDQATGVGFHADENASIYIRTKMRSQAVPESEEPSFTSIEPRPSGPSEEVRRMMHMVQINARRREAMLQEELHALRAQRAAPEPQLIEPEATPTATPAPAPAAPSDAPAE